jgi:hypothetical protein
MEEILKTHEFKRPDSDIPSYKRVTKNNVHWVNLFDDGSLRMFGYKLNDSCRCDYIIGDQGRRIEKIYDTGDISIDGSELEELIYIFITNHY